MSPPGHLNGISCRDRLAQVATRLRGANKRQLLPGSGSFIAAFAPRQSLPGRSARGRSGRLEATYPCPSRRSSRQRRPGLTGRHRCSAWLSSDRLTGLADFQRLQLFAAGARPHAVSHEPTADVPVRTTVLDSGRLVGVAHRMLAAGERYPRCASLRMAGALQELKLDAEDRLNIDWMPFRIFTEQPVAVYEPQDAAAKMRCSEPILRLSVLRADHARIEVEPAFDRRVTCTPSIPVQVDCARRARGCWLNVTSPECSILDATILLERDPKWLSW